jgi:hypothetical protein
MSELADGGHLAADIAGCGECLDRLAQGFSRRDRVAQARQHPDGEQTASRGANGIRTALEPGGELGSLHVDLAAAGVGEQARDPLPRADCGEQLERLGVARLPGQVVGGADAQRALLVRGKVDASRLRPEGVRDVAPASVDGEQRNAGEVARQGDRLAERRSE